MMQFMFNTDGTCWLASVEVNEPLLTDWCTLRAGLSITVCTRKSYWFVRELIGHSYTLYKRDEERTKSDGE